MPDLSQLTVPAIRLESVTKSYRKAGVCAVDQISLEVAPGEFLAIVGSSGSGKSTLLNLIGGIEHHDTGQVEIFGRNPATNRQWADMRARNIGMVFQSFHLLDTLTALENIIVPLFGRVRGATERRQRAQLLLDKVGLTNRWDHRPSELSGGERQRVAIARSLANNPNILLADEPTGNLDSRTAAAIFELFATIHTQDRMTLLLVTHERELAARADRVIELKDGRIIGHGEP